MKKITFFLSLFTSCSGLLYAQTDTVMMNDNSFSPATLTVKQGTKVVWINKSNLQHTSTSGTDCKTNGKWDSGILNPGQSFSFTFDAPGEHNYYCTPHCLSGMKGVVTVTQNSQEAGNNPDVKKKEVTQRPVANDEPGQSEEEESKKKRVQPSFKGLDIINAPSVNTLPKGVLDFSMYHRFDDLTGPNGGDQTLFGLDNMRDVRIALAYGITNRITLGLGRSKGDWFSAPIQEVKNLYDGSIKINIIPQDTGSRKKFITLTLMGNTVYTAMESQDVQDSEAHFDYRSDRFSHSGQVIIAHDFVRHLSVQLMPTYVRRNWVDLCSAKGDVLDVYGIGAGARWGFHDRVAILAEYYYVISEFKKNNPNVIYDPVAIGLEVNTGGHIFHINLSNATGLIPNTFLPYTTESIEKDGVRLGFSISRKFVTPKRKSNKEQ